MQATYNRDGALIVPQFVGFLLGSRTIVTTTGTSTYTRPSGVRALFVQCVGGGSGGNGAVNAAGGQLAVGPGGGSGAYAWIFLPVPTNPTGFTCIVNAGGAGVSGGNTSFALPNGIVVCQATGGTSGGAIASGTAETYSAGGPGGTIGLCIGDDAIAGNAGGPAHRVSGSVGESGCGGSGPLGGGSVAGNVAQGVGSAGGKYGGGGSGGLSINAGGAAAGGHGAQGVIVLWEFY